MASIKAHDSPLKESPPASSTSCDKTITQISSKKLNLKSNKSLKQYRSRFKTAGLLVKGTPDLKKLESIVIKNRIPINGVGLTDNGNTVIKCPDPETRAKLKPLLCADD